jgi:hypothetical protein
MCAISGVWSASILISTHGPWFGRGPSAITGGGAWSKAPGSVEFSREQGSEHEPPVAPGLVVHLDQGSLAASSGLRSGNQLRGVSAISAGPRSRAFRIAPQARWVERFSGRRGAGPSWLECGGRQGHCRAELSDEQRAKFPGGGARPFPGGEEVFPSASRFQTAGIAARVSCQNSRSMLAFLGYQSASCPGRAVGCYRREPK